MDTQIKDNVPCSVVLILDLEKKFCSSKFNNNIEVRVCIYRSILLKIAFTGLKTDWLGLKKILNLHEL